MDTLQARKSFAARHTEPSRIAVILPHTELALTEVALREAARLARGLDAQVVLLAVRIVQFPETLDPSRNHPDYPQLLALAESVNYPVTIHIVHARDWETGAAQVMPQSSLVVIASRKRWMRTREQRLANAMTRAGHKVTLVEA